MASPGIARLKKSLPDPDRLMTKHVTLPNGDVFVFKMKMLTLAQRERARKGTGDDTTAFALQLLVDKALEEDGITRSFTVADIGQLKNEFDASVIDDLVVELTRTDYDEESPDMKSDGQRPKG